MLTVALSLAVVIASPPGAEGINQDDLRSAMTSRLGQIEGSFLRELPVGSFVEPIHQRRALSRLYSGRDGAALWLTSGRPTRAARAAVAALEEAQAHGLVTGEYHHGALVLLLERHRRHSSQGGWSVEAAATFELLLSDGLLRYAAHLLSGRQRAGVFDPALGYFRHERDISGVVEQSAGGNFDEVWDTLTPLTPAYRRLMDAADRYRTLALGGGWEVVPEGPVLVLGQRAPSERLSVLRARMRATGDLTSREATNPERYDAELEGAVRRFQKRHGLEVDGKVGPVTRREMAIPARDRLRQIELSLERLRWLPHDLGKRHINVQIPFFRLELVENHRVILDMKVVVGRPGRPTHAFSDEMSFLVFNPHWEVPHNLAIEDELPQIKRDLGHLKRRGFEVLKGWDDHEQRIDPASVDWHELDRDNFPYRLRQKPSPEGALGRLKFMFPNNYDIYLHDTPAKALFDERDRAKSSGCIRVERPLELANELLEGTPLWNRWLVDDAVASRNQLQARLLHRVPVHLTYFTAWPDEEGAVHFRPDIYELDRPLIDALRRPVAPSW